MEIEVVGGVDLDAVESVFGGVGVGVGVELDCGCPCGRGSAVGGRELDNGEIAVFAGKEGGNDFGFDAVGQVECLNNDSWCFRCVGLQLDTFPAFSASGGIGIGLGLCTSSIRIAQALWLPIRVEMVVEERPFLSSSRDGGFALLELHLVHRVVAQLSPQECFRFATGRIVDMQRFAVERKACERSFGSARDGRRFKDDKCLTSHPGCARRHHIQHPSVGREKRVQLTPQF